LGDIHQDTVVGQLGNVHLDVLKFQVRVAESGVEAVGAILEGTGAIVGDLAEAAFDATTDLAEALADSTCKLLGFGCDEGDKPWYEDAFGFSAISPQLAIDRDLLEIATSSPAMGGRFGSSTGLRTGSFGKGLAGGRTPYVILNGVRLRPATLELGNGVEWRPPLLTERSDATTFRTGLRLAVATSEDIKEIAPPLLLPPAED
jgi:hypothetical protein